MIFVTRKEQFNAAHKLYNDQWTPEKNLEVFGKCANPNWHGHNYDLYITLKGDPDPDTGFVFDLKIMSEIIRTVIIDKLDHKNINLDVDFMKGKFASTELLAVGIWDQLEKHFNTSRSSMHCIRLQETERNYVEYFGPGR